MRILSFVGKIDVGIGFWLFVIFMFAILSIVIACGNSGESLRQKVILSDGNWSIVQSPLTDSCYEVYQESISHGAFMGMNEVSCDEYLR